ncbi:bacteriophage T4 gp5 trimerisation domain-containing protein, partial [Pseudomonas sp. BMS12]|uniref:bacteriophage T4 gp5 trimerisation domain-containing protein n=1 Tax=Pseudomonas sp. BMS12 TaxID=1796033 RepID=UPI000ADF5E93
TLSSPGGGGYNELRIEDRKGQEQIYIHAQKDWDENVEHDQKIRIGHERHDTVEANSYTELKAEEHRTTHADRKTEIRANDHLTVATTQHVKLGTGQFVEAGNEIHYYAGSKVVIDAGMELTAKGGGSFLKLDPSGVTLSGATIKMNSGGAPGAGSGNTSMLPIIPLPAATDKAGKLLKQALSQPAPDVIHTLSLLISPLPEHPGYKNEPYSLYADGQLLQEELTGPDGRVTFKHLPGTCLYAIELVNGHRFEIEASEAIEENPPTLSEQLARQGYRDYHAQADQLAPLQSAEDYRLAAWASSGKTKS